MSAKRKEPTGRGPVETAVVGAKDRETNRGRTKACRVKDTTVYTDDLGIANTSNVKKASALVT